MSESKDLNTSAKEIEEEPEEGEIQDDEGSLEDVSSDEDISTRNDSYSDKYVSPLMIPQYMHRPSSYVTNEICNLKTRQYYRSSSESIPKIIGKRKEKTSLPNSEVHQMRYSSISKDLDHANFDIIPNDHTKSARPKQNVKEGEFFLIIVIFKVM